MRDLGLFSSCYIQAEIKFWQIIINHCRLCRLMDQCVRYKLFEGFRPCGLAYDI